MGNVRQSASWVQRSHHRGVTLIELMVSIALLAILLAIAAPNFRGMTASSRLTSSSNELLASIQQARAQAIRTGMRVTVCKSTDGAQCNTQANVGWDRGWIVFGDTTRSGVDAAVDTGETIITRVAAADAGSGSSIVGTTLVANYVSFAADGRPRLMGGGVQTGTLRICAPGDVLSNGARARDIVLSTTGQVNVIRPANVADNCPSP